jgi:hypothetical protein
MSNKGTIIGFIIGSIVGSASTYVVLKKYFEKREKEDVESVKKSFGERDQNLCTPDKAPEQKEPAKDVKPDIIKEAFPKSVIKEYKNYQSIYGGDDNSDEEDGDAEAEHPMDDNESPKQQEEKKKPYIVCRGENPSDYIPIDTISCTYYTEDHVLADDLTNEFIDVESSIGTDIASEIENNDEDLYYVKDPRQDTYYEISVIKESYNEVASQDYAGGSRN